MAPAQRDLFEADFETLRPPNPVYCHQEFLEKLESHRNSPVAKRATLLMQRLAVDERRQHYKATQGVNQGWRRSRLGGTHGNQFYAWWAPRSAAPFKAGEGFQEAPEGAIFLRDIRHHDDHSAAHAHSFQGHYLPVSVYEMRREDYGPAPWTPQQTRFASARQPVRILKGHPGSGKTTALLHAADASGARQVLYVTYSRELALLARDYFDRYCSRGRRFHVVTYDALLRQMLGSGEPRVPYKDLRHRFRSDLLPYSRSFGPWADCLPALYDEMHAHLVGAAVPAAAGRFPLSSRPRCEDKDYRTRRIRYLGQPAAAVVLDLAQRLERNDPRTLAERYFPELSLAWQAAAALSGRGGPAPAPEFLDFDCIAVDECQDLTPIEAFVLVELAAAAGRARRAPVQVFLAGDEAQTVRPTDFEWGWMNDLLHFRLGTPSEFNLAANLRSPFSIASLVNRVWDLYAEIEKRDRPGGTGYAEIEDDATDQILYCTASPGEDLDRLIADLTTREGLAIIGYGDAALKQLPPQAAASVLTPAEAKGLDFHTVCLLNAGEHLERILMWEMERRFAAADIESIRRRLAIDELRVGVSRPAERLIWLDISPAPRIVRATLDFLNWQGPALVSPTVPPALMTALAEEQLDLDERIQRCQADARQYLDVRPDLAWSRAQQAVALAGARYNPAAVRDESIRNGAQLTLSEICFCLGMRRAQLAPELGHPNLFEAAAEAAPNPGLKGLIRALGQVCRTAASAEDLQALGTLAQEFALRRADIEPWILAEIEGKTGGWLRNLEAALPIGDNALTLSRILPPFYDALRLPGAESRKAQLFDRALKLLLKGKRHAQALELLKELKEPQPELQADCLAALGNHAEAAGLYRSVGKLKEALACYRAQPDFEAAAGMIRSLPDHPAAEAYDWLIRLKKLLDERPANFNRVMTMPEKKVLEKMLEQGLGVARKPPAPRKTATKKAASVPSTRKTK